MNKTQTQPHPGDKAVRCPGSIILRSTSHVIQMRQKPWLLPAPNCKTASLQIFPSSVDGATIHLDAQAKNKGWTGRLLVLLSPTFTPSASPVHATSETAQMFTSLHRLCHLPGPQCHGFSLGSCPYLPPTLPTSPFAAGPSSVPHRQSQWALWNHPSNTTLHAHLKTSNGFLLHTWNTKTPNPGLQSLMCSPYSLHITLHTWLTMSQPAGTEGFVL